MLTEPEGMTLQQTVTCGTAASTCFQEAEQTMCRNYSKRPIRSKGQSMNTRRRRKKKSGLHIIHLNIHSSAVKLALLLILFVSSDLMSQPSNIVAAVGTNPLEDTWQEASMSASAPFGGGSRTVRASIGPPDGVQTGGLDSVPVLDLPGGNLHETEEEATPTISHNGELSEQPHESRRQPTVADVGALELPALKEESSHVVNTNHLASSKLRIVRLLAPEATQNGTQNVTIDCMFKFDKKLDQRLTIKWFFNDEVEPIYQWIPELNKRVYSDKYERFLDKTYEVSEDVDFMLQAYRWLLAAGQDTTVDADSSAAAANSQEERAQLEASRKVLAGRLNKLAKLGGRHSRQLLDSLRAALDMDQLEWSKFRALRLIRPTTELNGRFTCSVSSLDGDDLRSTKLVIYEPAKSFNFNVSRASNSQHYNLTCQASQVFPRPALALVRYRAGPLEPQYQPLSRQHAHRHPKLAATLLRQEPIPGTQTQLTVNAVRQQSTVSSHHHELAPATIESNDITSVSVADSTPDSISQPTSSADQQTATVYEISSWALVDESSLSSNVVTQFECVLTIEGTSYEQRQTIALQKGWHVNSAALASRATLVGLFSALASLLCLMLALVSSMLIFRLLKRYAKNRVHQEKSDDNTNSGFGSGSECTNSTGGLGVGLDSTTAQQATSSSARQLTSQQEPSSTMTTSNSATQQCYAVAKKPTTDHSMESDGVYRVPESTFGTRFVIGSPGNRHYYTGQQQNINNRQQPHSGNSSEMSTHPQSGSSFHQVSTRQQYTPATIPPPSSYLEPNNRKPLYC